MVAAILMIPTFALAATSTAHGAHTPYTAHTHTGGIPPVLTAHAHTGGIPPVLTAHAHAGGIQPVLTAHTHTGGIPPVLTAHVHAGGIQPVLTAHAHAGGIPPVLTAHAHAGGIPPVLTARTAGPEPTLAHAPRTLNVTDTAHMHYTRELGSMLVDEGTATGGLPGKVVSRFDVGATAVSATFTIHAQGGSISGHGSGALHGVGVTVSFGGTMTVTHGTGRYAHARGHGGLYGTLNRHNYAAVIQTTGTLTY